MDAETAWEGTLDMRGIHVGLIHWPHAALVTWLRLQIPSVPALALPLADPDLWWQIVGRPTHTTADDGACVATYRVRATRRAGRA